MWTKVRGGALVALGYMLSPLSWWNDLFFNLPIAYGLGWIFGLISKDWILPMTVVGYWVSNVLGILMMQWGATDVFAKAAKTTDPKNPKKTDSDLDPDPKAEAQPRNWRREVVIGLASSTVYTLVVVGLVRFHVVDVASLFPMLG